MAIIFPDMILDYRNEEDELSIIMKKHLAHRDEYDRLLKDYEND